VRLGKAATYPDHLAAVIDVIDRIDIAQLQVAYQRIAQAKNLRKSPAAHIPGTPHTTRTHGVILANTSSVPLEELAAELDRLNQQTPDFGWPDMVAVLSTGTINFAVQFPGEPVSADGVEDFDAKAHFIPITNHHAESIVRR
jgi:hypothetical protein